MAKEQAVVVTTKHKGVFFGYTSDTKADIVELKRARCCVFWPRENKGFVGLASMGPVKGARIGPAAPSIELRDITSVIACSPEAVTAWEAAPWNN